MQLSLCFSTTCSWLSFYLQKNKQKNQLALRLLVFMKHCESIVFFIVSVGVYIINFSRLIYLYPY